MKSFFFITAFLISSQTYAQSILNEWHFNYSPKYKLGAGIDVGYETKTGNVFRLNSLVYLGRSITLPMSANISYGYSVSGILPFVFQPFVLGGLYTTGGESVKDGEGSSGIEYGGGMMIMLLQKESDELGMQIEVGSKITNIGLSFSSGLIVQIRRYK